MANQNPQPSMLTARFDVPTGAIAVGTTYSNVVTTQQAYNEIIYVYGLFLQPQEQGTRDLIWAQSNYGTTLASITPERYRACRRTRRPRPACGWS